MQTNKQQQVYTPSERSHISSVENKTKSPVEVRSFGVDRKKSASVQAQNSIQPRTVDSQYPNNLRKKKIPFLPWAHLGRHAQEEASPLKYRSEHRRHRLTSAVTWQLIPRTDKSQTMTSKVRFQSQGFSDATLLKTTLALQEGPSRELMTILFCLTTFHPCNLIFASHPFLQPLLFGLIFSWLWCWRPIIISIWWSIPIPPEEIPPPPLSSPITSDSYKHHQHLCLTAGNKSALLPRLPATVASDWKRQLPSSPLHVTSPSPPALSSQHFVNSLSEFHWTVP